MKNRRGLIVVGLAVAAWVVVAIVLGTGLLSTSELGLAPGGRSPACLPPNFVHNQSMGSGSSAVSVSPAPGSRTANPNTQISFLGQPAFDIHNLSVRGSKTGWHGGRIEGYFQGDGASFVPNHPFDTGEWVNVAAIVGPNNGGSPISWGFRVATPYPTNIIASFPNPPIPSAAVQTFHSRSDIQAPLLSITTPDQDPAAGEIFMTTGPGPGQYGPLIFNPLGQLIWFNHLPNGDSAENFSVQSYEGQQDLTWWQGRVLNVGFGEGKDIVMNSNYQTVAEIHGGNGLTADLHEFNIAGNHIAYITAYSVIRCDLGSINGAVDGVVVDNAIQEVDMKTGLVRWQWDILDHVNPFDSHSPVPTDASPWDIAHVNSIDPQPDGDLIVSSRSAWAIYRIQKGSGQIEWTLGGRNSSFTLPSNAVPAWQHDARLHADGTLTVFDDGSTPREHYQSRGLVLSLDQTAHTARVVRQYFHPGPLLADSQGNMQMLASGNVVVGWGAMPDISEFSASGSLRFDGHLAPGLGSYRAFRFPWTGRPLTQPSVSARLIGTGDDTAVFASWNGATDVASWRVLAGPDTASLVGESTWPTGGYETSMIVPQAYKFVAVEALAKDGTLLGTSPTISVFVPPKAG